MCSERVDNSTSTRWKEAAPCSPVLEHRSSHDSAEACDSGEASQPCSTPFRHTSTPSARGACLRDTGSRWTAQLWATSPEKGGAEKRGTEPLILSECFFFFIACTFQFVSSQISFTCVQFQSALRDRKSKAVLPFGRQQISKTGPERETVIPDVGVCLPSPAAVQECNCGEHFATYLRQGLC